MFCPECGTRNEDNARFCEACGTSLLEYQTPPSPKPGQADPAQQIRGQQIPPVNQTAPKPQQAQAQSAGPAPQVQPRQVPPVRQTAPPPPPQQPRQPQPRPKQPRPPRKPIPIGALLAVIIEGVLAVALVIGIIFVLNSKFSPESVALNYWKAVTAHQWGEAYDYCEFPESDFLTKQMYVNVNSARDEEPILQYKSVSAEREGGWGEQLFGSDANSGTYVIKYMTKGNSYEETEYLTLSKTGEKKFLFWDEWKVTSSDSWCQDVYFEIPRGATMKLNGVEVPEEYSSEDEDWKYIKIPYMFIGSYQIEVTAEGMEPYRVVADDVGYAGEVNWHFELRPSQETIEAVAGRAGDDLKKIMDSVLAGEGFDAIQDCFSESALSDGYVMEEYGDLSRITGDGVEEGIVTLTMDSMVTFLDEKPYQNVMYFRLQANVKETYLRYWTDELGEYEDTVDFYFIYVREGDTWKLDNMPVSRYDFYY